MKNIFKVFYVAVFIIAINSQLKAQSAVYFCTETGAFGFAYGYDTKSEAEDAAYNSCIDYGGTNPQLVTSTSSRGYGAIALGKSEDGGRVIGVALGYSSLSEAKADALKKCRQYGGEDAYIEKTFKD